MSTKKLTKDLAAVLLGITENGASDDLLFERHYLDEAMNHYRLRRQYEQARIAYAIHREFADSEAPLTEQEMADLDEAEAMTEEITQLLRGIKNGQFLPQASRKRTSEHRSGKTA